MRVPLHIVEKRREQLRNLIRTDGFLPIAEICRQLGVSEATARRDLVAIAAHGQITRTRGGALADYNTAFASLGQRAQRARTAKARIADAAIAQFPRTGVVFLDAGTTVQSIAFLPHFNKPFCATPRKLFFAWMPQNSAKPPLIQSSVGTSRFSSSPTPAPRISPKPVSRCR